MKHNFPKSWSIAPFTDVLDIQGGTQPPKSEFAYSPQKGYIRLLQIRDFGEKPVPTYVTRTSKLKICQKEDILIARYGASIGRILTGMEGAYNVALAKVIIPNQFDKKYIYYLLKSEIFQEPILLTKRSAQDGFNKSDLNKILIPIPPIKEQIRIGHAIENILNKLERAKKRIAILPDNLTTIKNHVINLAASGSLTSDWRSFNLAVQSAPTLLEGLIANRENEYEQKNKDYKNKIGSKPRKPILNNPIYNKDFQFEIPSSWSWSTLGNIAEIVSGVTKGKRYESQNLVSIPYLSVSNVQDGYLSLNEVKQIKVPQAEIEKYRLLTGDILMTEGGDRDKLGRGTVWEGEIVDCIHQNHIFRARVNHNFIDPYYVTYFTKSSGATSYFFEKANQTVNLASISMTALSNLPIPIPPFEEQKEIVNQLKKYFGLLETIEKSYINSANYIEALQRQTFTKAFSGELVEQELEDDSSSDLLSTIKSSMIMLRTESITKNIIGTTRSIIMKPKPIKTFQELRVCLENLGGSSTPNDLLSATLLENDIDLFYELIRSGRDQELLEVPVGNSGIIKLIGYEAK